MLIISKPLIVTVALTLIVNPSDRLLELYKTILQRSVRLHLARAREDSTNSIKMRLIVLGQESVSAIRPVPIPERHGERSSTLPR